MSNDRRSGGPPRRRGTPSESAVQEKLARIRQRRAQRQAARSQAPPQPEPAAAVDDDDDEGEATQAFNIADFDLDDVAAAPVPKRQAAAAAPPDEDDEDDDGDKTAAFSLDDMSDLLGEPVAAPAAAARPPEPEEDEDEDEDERTAAISLDEMGDLLGGVDETVDISHKQAQRAVSDYGADAPQGDADRTMMVDVEMVDLADGPAQAAPAPAPEPEPPVLVVVAGNDAGKRVELTQEVTLVGRGLDADFVVNDASASRRHFNIVQTSSGWKLVDLGSGNGTRVDGSRVDEIALVDGMTVECGTTVMRWEDSAPDSAPTLAMRDFDDGDDDADKTRMGDMAALEIDPDWESRRARQLVDAQQGHETVAQPVPDSAPPPQLVERQHKGGAGKTIAIISGLIVLAGGGFVAADKFAGLGIIFPKEATTTTSPSEGDDDGGGQVGVTAAKSGAKEEAKALVAEGEVAITEGRWHEARKHFNEALELDPKAARDNGDPVEDSLLQVDAQLAAQNLLLDAKKALQDDRPEQALEALKKIRMDTSVYKNAQDLMPQVRDLFVAEKLTAARAAEEKGDYEAAKAAVGAALSASKDDADALAMQFALERATAPDADNLETDEEDPAKRVQPVKVPKVSMSEGFSLYAQGNFMGAIDFFDGIHYGRANRRDKAKAKAIAGAITKFETVYNAASKQLEGGEPGDALNNLRQARKYDAAVNGAFRNKLGLKMAKAYAAQAKSAFAAKKLSAAGGYAQRALKLDPSNADAKTIADQVVSTAREWLASAKAEANDNPDKAMGLLSKVVNAMPEGHPSYQEAYKLLNQLAKASDE